MRFTDLMDTAPPGMPGEQQTWAAKQFPRWVEQSHMAIWRPQEPIPQHGLRVLLGVAPAWNRYDLILLDLIESRLATQPAEPIIVHVFDADQCRSVEELHEFIPGLQKPVGLPLWGLWIKGRLVDSGFGEQSRSRLLAFLGIRPARFASASFADSERRHGLLVHG